MWLQNVAAVAGETERCGKPNAWVEGAENQMDSDSLSGLGKFPERMS